MPPKQPAAQQIVTTQVSWREVSSRFCNGTDSASLRQFLHLCNDIDVRNSASDVLKKWRDTKHSGIPFVWALLHTMKSSKPLWCRRSHAGSICLFYNYGNICRKQRPDDDLHACVMCGDSHPLKAYKLDAAASDEETNCDEWKMLVEGIDGLAKRLKTSKVLILHSLFRVDERDEGGCITLSRTLQGRCVITAPSGKPTYAQLKRKIESLEEQILRLKAGNDDDNEDVSIVNSATLETIGSEHIAEYRRQLDNQNFLNATDDEHELQIVLVGQQMLLFCMCRWCTIRPEQPQVTLHELFRGRYFTNAAEDVAGIDAVVKLFPAILCLNDRSAFYDECASLQVLQTAVKQSRDSLKIAGEYLVGHVFRLHAQLRPLLAMKQCGEYLTMYLEERPVENRPYTNESLHLFRRIVDFISMMHDPDTFKATGIATRKEARPMCHGDIKLDNILVTTEASASAVGILDASFWNFECKPTGESTDDVDSVLSTVTKVPFSSFWAAPQQQTTGRPLREHDRWSLGLVIGELFIPRATSEQKASPRIPIVLFDLLVELSRDHKPPLSLETAWQEWCTCVLTTASGIERPERCPRLLWTFLRSLLRFVPAERKLLRHHFLRIDPVRLGGMLNHFIEIGVRSVENPQEDADVANVWQELRLLSPKRYHERLPDDVLLQINESTKIFALSHDVQARLVEQQAEVQVTEALVVVRNLLTHFTICLSPVESVVDVMNFYDDLLADVWTVFQRNNVSIKSARFAFGSVDVDENDVLETAAAAAAPSAPPKKESHSKKPGRENNDFVEGKKKVAFKN